MILGLIQINEFYLAIGLGACCCCCVVVGGAGGGGGGGNAARGRFAHQPPQWASARQASEHCITLRPGAGYGLCGQFAMHLERAMKESHNCERRRWEPSPSLSPGAAALPAHFDARGPPPRAQPSRSTKRRRRRLRARWRGKGKVGGATSPRRLEAQPTICPPVAQGHRWGRSRRALSP